jgi:hypothetical protein
MAAPAKAPVPGAEIIDEKMRAKFREITKQVNARCSPLPFPCFAALRLL